MPKKEYKSINVKDSTEELLLSCQNLMRDISTGVRGGSAQFYSKDAVVRKALTLLHEQLHHEKLGADLRKAKARKKKEDPGVIDYKYPATFSGYKPRAKAPKKSAVGGKAFLGIGEPI